jgi:hypothetical protein
MKKSKAEEKENLYKPKTGAPPLNRNLEKLPIGDYLYRKHKKQPIVIRPLQTPVINESSRVIYDKRKEEAFMRLFQYLDVRHEGKIVWSRIKP